MSAEQKRIEREWLALAELRDQCRVRARREQRDGKYKDAALTRAQLAKANARCRALEADYQEIIGIGIKDRGLTSDDASMPPARI